MKKEEELITRYFNQDLSKDEMEELDQLLGKSSDLREKFYDQANVNTALETEFSSNLPDKKMVSFESRPSNVSLLAFAASLLLSIGIIGYSIYNEEETIATSSL